VSAMMRRGRFNVSWARNYYWVDLGWGKHGRWSFTSGLFFTIMGKEKRADPSVHGPHGAGPAGPKEKEWRWTGTAAVVPAASERQDMQESLAGWGCPTAMAGPPPIARPLIGLLPTPSFILNFWHRRAHFKLLSD
jgi:hypothetical protein